ncbi:MAG: DUF2812 domain-containing protein [Clostridia bacterium]|nr:DUF2812 domain-containing protein [Clostridia bacterium]
MRKTIRKWFWVWEFDKEEKWLNEMAAKGLTLVSMHFNKYMFEETTPGEYQIRVELLANKPAHPESEQYIRFVEETGAEQVASWINWVYFRKKTADGAFELFSDNTSRLKMLNRVIGLLVPLGILCLVSGGYNLLLYFLWGNPVSLVGLLPLTVSVLLGIGLLRILKQKKKLAKEQTLFE